MRQSLAEISHGQRLLLALGEAGQAVQRAHSQQAIFEIVGEKMTQLNFDAIILSLNEAQNKLSIAHATLRPEKAQEAKAVLGMPIEQVRFPVTAKNTLVHQLLNERKPFFRKLTPVDIAEALPMSMRPLAKQFLDLLDFNESISAPLFIGNDPFGLLLVIGESLGEADVSAVSVLANQVGVALENAQLYQEIRQQAEQLQLILDILPEGVILLGQDQTIKLTNPVGNQQLEILSEARLNDRLELLGEVEIKPLLQLSKPMTGWQELTLKDEK